MLMFAWRSRQLGDGFSIVELLIVITIIGILSGLTFGIVRSYSYSGQDSERVSDAESIARAFEISYFRDATTNGPTYPSTVRAVNAANYGSLFAKQDLEITKAPERKTGTSIVAATTTVRPQSPTKDQYIYLPLTADGSLCSSTNLCVRFLLYYRLEHNNELRVIESIRQQ